MDSCGSLGWTAENAFRGRYEDPSSKETVAAGESRHFRFGERRPKAVQLSIAHDLVGIDRSAIHVAEPQPQAWQITLVRRHQEKRNVPLIEHRSPVPDDLGLMADIGARDCEYHHDGQERPQMKLKAARMNSGHEIHAHSFLERRSSRESAEREFRLHESLWHPKRDQNAAALRCRLTAQALARLIRFGPSKRESRR